MDAATQTAEQLRLQIAATEDQLKKLKDKLAKLDAQNGASSVETSLEGLGLEDPVTRGKWPLSSEEYKRYGRQMIVPNIGIQGQLRLKTASVLIVGAGGLGCPAAAYIAGAGVGTIGIVDRDEVENSNLHRQILHSTSKVGMKKVDSAISYLKSLNPNLKYNAHTSHLTPENSESIVSQYDLVLDCTDHPTSRYLISDICVLLQKPLVSASALRTDGQLIVLNSPPLPPGNEAGGPCYRCVFPKPPPAESVVSCGDGGILGPVVGVMGVLQALEAIKLIASGKLTADGSEEVKKDANMLLFSANSNPPFRSLRLRSRRAKCFACSSESGLTLEGLSSGSLDYVLFCGVHAPVSILRSEERVEAREYEKIRKEKGAGHLLVDTRERVQFDICNIEGSINIPISNFQGNRARAADGELPSWIPETLPPDAPIYVVCRLGNDSQVVTRELKEAGLDKNGRYIGDIKGGLKSWKQQVDSSWPEY
ncbi:Molybdopterin-synthase sulfurtransferase [Acephala macrosclerotiorum]|nr:Molybdopterin-synthase sulfurtransferase [Acephala macrosclerotiorum]